MRLYLAIAAGFIAVLGGGYYFANSWAQKKADEIVAQLERNIESRVPGGDLSYDQTHAKLLNRTVVIEGLAFELEGKRIGTASTLEIAINDKNIDLFSLKDFTLKLDSEDKTVDITGDSLSLVDVDVNMLRSFIKAVRQSPKQSLNSLKLLTFGEIDIQTLGLKSLDANGDPIQANVNLNIKDASKGVAEKITFSGNISRDYNVKGPSLASIGSLKILGFDFGSFVSAWGSGDEAMLLGLKTAYNIRDIQIEDLKFESPIEETNMSLASGHVKISNSIVEHLDFKDFALTGEEDFNIKVGESKFEGFDLTLDFSSSEMRLASFLKMSKINMSNVSSVVKGKDVKLREIGKLTRLTKRSDSTGTGEVFIRDFEIPFALIDPKNSQKNIIQSITKRDNLVLNFEASGGFDFKSEPSSQSTTSVFSAKDFGLLRLFYDWNIDQNQIEALAVTPEFLEGVYDKNLLFKFYKAIDVKAIKIDYEDQNLADALIQNIEDIDKVIHVVETLVSNIFSQYPKEREALLAAINGFVEGKNTFSVGLTAEKPIPSTDILNLFMSGKLKRVATLEFEGN